MTKNPFSSADVWICRVKISFCPERLLRSVNCKRQIPFSRDRTPRLEDTAAMSGKRGTICCTPSGACRTKDSKRSKAGPESPAAFPSVSGRASRLRVIWGREKRRWSREQSKSLRAPHAGLFLLLQPLWHRTFPLCSGRLLLPGGSLFRDSRRAYQKHGHHHADDRDRYIVLHPGQPAKPHRRRSHGQADKGTAIQATMADGFTDSVGWRFWM